jgi:hypothetical protein
MMADLRLQVIHRTVAELVAFESEVAGRLERAQQLSSGYPDALAAIQRLRPMVQIHRDQLATYLKDSGGAEPNGETTSPRSTSREATALSVVLRDLCLAFHHCALSYAMLYEVALRLYEPRLREIAPEPRYPRRGCCQGLWLGNLPRTGFTAHVPAPCAASVPAAACHGAPNHL